MTSGVLLLAALFLPLLGAGLLWVIAPAGRDAVRYAALGVSLLTLAAAALTLKDYPTTDSPDAFAVNHVPWLEGRFAVGFDVGLDGLGVWMFGLSALLFVTAILVSWEAIKDREPLFYAMLLMLEFGCLGVFCARDLLLFYVFFEFTLIPLFFLIGIWGSEDRRYAATKFFLYTLAGSLLTFLGLLAIVIWDYQQSGLGVMRFSIPDLVAGLSVNPLPPSMQLWIFLALFCGFAIKVPLFPVHTWLPLAHVQAPTAGSVILAGVLLKIGVYGFARFSMPMLPAATVTCAPWILALSVAGIIYGALVALAQGDIKRLIAYSSVSHMGYCMLGLFSLNVIGMNGGLLQMVNHGLSTGGLFAVVGMTYERYHTREISKLGGLARRAPWLAFFMVVFTFSSIGLPGLNGFTGEFMILLGMFQRAWEGVSGLDWAQGMLLAVLSVSGVVLGAWYMLQLVQKVFFGPLKEPGEHAAVVSVAHGQETLGHEAHGHDAHSHATEISHHDEHAVQDLSLREILALAPLVVFMVWIGLKPQDFLPTFDRPVRAMVAKTDDVIQQRGAALEPTVRHSPEPQPASPAALSTPLLPAEPDEILPEKVARVR